MKNKILKLFSIFLLLFMITNTYAIEVGEAGNIVTQDGEYSSTRFVAGNKVTNNANVDGLSFVAGNEITLNGKAPYGFYAGNIVIVNENIEKDMFVAGNHVTIGSDAIIGRDIFIAGNTVVIKANIARNLRVGASTVDLSNITIEGNAYVMADEILLNEATNIKGKLSYVDDSKIIGLNEATIGSVEVSKHIENNNSYTFKEKAIDYLLSIIAAYIVVLALFFIIPKSKEKIDNFELEVKNIAKTSGIGFIVLILVPLISIIAIFTQILIPLSFITIAIYLISIYLSFLVVYYLVGNVITNKLLNTDNVYIALLIGIIVVKLLYLIPYVGGILRFISLIFGMGLIYKFIINIRNNEKSTK